MTNHDTYRDARHHRQAVSLQQAAAESVALSALMERVRKSNTCLQLILPLLPVALHTAVRAGSWDEERRIWCLLAGNNATAARLRQLLPAMQAQLNTAQAGVSQIHIRVRPATS